MKKSSFNMQIGPSSLSKRSDLHLIRKIWHICTGLLGFYGYFSLNLSKETTAFYLLILSAIVFIVEHTRLNHKSFNALVLKVMGSFMRKSEVDHYSGFIFYSLGTALSLFFYEEKYAILAILFLVFADPISSTFGVLFGKNKYLPNKSVEGSLACAVTCFVITWLYMSTYHFEQRELLILSLAASIIGPFSEALSVWLDDNLTIPLVSGFGLSVVSSFL